MAGPNPTRRFSNRKHINALQPTDATYYAGDAHTANLYIKVPPTGDRRFVLRWKRDGAQRSLVLGPIGEPLAPADTARYGLPHGALLDLDNARHAAGYWRATIRSGGDPREVLEREAAEREALERTGRTFNSIAEEWFEAKVKNKFRRPEIVRAMFNRDLLPAFGHWRIDQLTRDLFGSYIGERAKTAPVAANRVLLYAKQIMAFAYARGYLLENVLLPLTRKDAGGKERSRERNLSFDELGTWVRTLWSPQFYAEAESRALLQFLTLTGQRVGECANAKWAHVDLEGKTWRIPDTKAGRTEQPRPHLVHLSDAAVDVLKGIARLTGGKGYVFESGRLKPNEAARPVGERAVARVVRRLFDDPAAIPDARKRMAKPNAAKSERFRDRPTLHGKMPSFTTHDLRRTMASRMADLGIAPHVIEKCLNHKLEGVLAVYQRAEWLPERQAAFEAWGAKIAALLASDPSKVVDISTRRAA